MLTEFLQNHGCIFVSYKSFVIDKLTGKMSKRRAYWDSPKSNNNPYEFRYFPEDGLLMVTKKELIEGKVKQQSLFKGIVHSLEDFKAVVPVEVFSNGYELVEIEYQHGNSSAHLRGIVQLKEADRSKVIFRYWSPISEDPEIIVDWVPNNEISAGWAFHTDEDDLFYSLTDQKATVHDLTEHE